MKSEFIEDQVAQQGWVNPTEKALDALSDVTVEKWGRRIRNFLHGVWLGHPLHAASVEVPIGALATTTILDVMGAVQETKRFEPGAKVALNTGLITASFAAASGLADWSKSDQPARRVGVLHAALNGTATLCYAASWVLRRRGERKGAVGTSVAGFLILGLGAYLGGRMVYNHKLGVDHAQRGGPDGFTPVMPDMELPEGEPHRVEVEGVGILLIKQNGRVFAIGEKCSHLGGPLAEGKLEGNTITCPWHGSKFNIETGKVVEGPAVYAEPCFSVRVQRGQIEVRLNKKM